MDSKSSIPSRTFLILTVAFVTKSRGQALAVLVECVLSVNRVKTIWEIIIRSKT